MTRSTGATTTSRPSPRNATTSCAASSATDAASACRGGEADAGQDAQLGDSQLAAGRGGRHREQRHGAVVEGDGRDLDIAVDAERALPAARGGPAVGRLATQAAR